MADPGTEAETDPATTADAAIAAARQESEGRARRMGWMPKEEFRGDPAKWMEADAFVQRSENELPILRERYRTIDRKLESTERELSNMGQRLQQQNDTLKEYVEFSRKAEDRAFNRAKRELEQKRREQIAAADVNAAEATSREIEELVENKPAAPTVKPNGDARPNGTVQPAAATIQPETEAFIQANPWFNTDAGMRGYAIGENDKIVRANPNMPLGEQLAEVSRRVRQTFPAAFGNPAREIPAAAVTTSSAPGGGKKGKGYGDLPPEAKAACDKFVKQIPGYKREEYVKQYFVGEEA